MKSRNERVRRGLGAVLFGWMVLASYLLADGASAAALPSDGGDAAAVSAGAAPTAPAATSAPVQPDSAATTDRPEATEPAAAADPAGGASDPAATPPAAQDPAASPAAAAPSKPTDDDLEPSLTEPDFVVATIPTTLRLPRHKLVFRLTHRFARPLGEGDFGDLVEDFFGFDSAALVGLELRFGLFSGTQLGVYRTNDRTIQFFLNRDIVQQSHAPIGIGLLAA